MSKDTFYFSHDYNPRTDPKITRLLVKHGWAGYGIFWALVEDLYSNANAMPSQYDCIAYALRADVNLVKSVILDFDLFVVKNGIFSSNSVAKRLLKREEKSQKARKSAESRWHADASKNNADAMRPHSERNAIKESKVKDSKVNGNKPTGLGLFPSPDLKKEYRALEKELIGKPFEVVWSALRDFVAKRPPFAEPYVELWNIFQSKIEALSEVKGISEERRRKVMSRIQDANFDFVKILAEIKVCKKLHGEGMNGWKVTFDFIFENGNNYLKILEGNYR